MIRHVGTLRPNIRYPRRLAPRSNGACCHRPLQRFDSTKCSHRARQLPRPAPEVLLSHLHHDARRRRDDRRAAPLPASRAFGHLRVGAVAGVSGSGIFTAVPRSQRMYFRAGDPPGGGGSSSGSSSGSGSGSGSGVGREARIRGQPAATVMDEETKKSIGKSDEKAKKSMQTVKLALAGNLVITVAKFLAYLHSGSSAMSSEAMHSLVDAANQLLLVVGLRSAATAPDKQHQYGYGKAVYFWCLVSALGTFWLGAGVSMRHSIEELMNPTVALDKVGLEVWGVLGLSLLIDGYVLVNTFQGIWDSKPEGMSFIRHMRNVRDPTTLAVLLEDGAACLGVVMAIVGTGLSQMYQNPVYDSLAGVSIAGLLGIMGLVLTEMNRRFLIGQSVDSETTEGIKAILMSRGSIEQLHQVQSQWVGTHTFAFKAEVDFDGTYLAAKLKVNTRYGEEFKRLLQRDSNDEAKFKDHETLLSFYAEDVMRLAEREVREAETEIRKKYPEAAYIELEPDSSTHNMFALEQFQTPALRKVEEKTMKQILANLVIAKATEEANLSSDPRKARAKSGARGGKLKKKPQGGERSSK